MGTSEATILGVLALLLLSAGIALLRAGAWPRRTGRTPHCSKCDYIVAGVESGRCPECGQAITSGSIVYGERVRRRGRIGWGASIIFVALIIGALSIVQGARLVRWYEWKPAAWVIQDLESTNPTIAQRAWNELDRRMKTGNFASEKHPALVDAANRRIASDMTTLGIALREHLQGRLGAMTETQREKYFQQLLIDLGSRSFVMADTAQLRLHHFIQQGHLNAQRRTALVELALAAQADAVPRQTGDSPSKPPATQALMVNSRDWLIEFLGQSAIDGSLNPEQRERFFLNASIVELRVRPTVIAGEDLPYHIRYDGKGPNRWWIRRTMGEVRLGGKVVSQGGGSSSGSIGGGSTGSWVKITQSGEATLELDAAIEIGKSEREVLHRRELKLKANFNALKEAPAGYIKWVEQLELKLQLQRALSVRDVHSPSWRENDLHLMIAINSLPCDIAFDVIGRVDGVEHVIGAASGVKGTTSSTGVSKDPFVPVPSGKMDVILRSSEIVARRSVDVLTPWKGEIVFHDVTVTPRKK